MPTFPSVLAFLTLHSVLPRYISPQLLSHCLQLQILHAIVLAKLTCLLMPLGADALLALEGLSMKYPRPMSLVLGLQPRSAVSSHAEELVPSRPAPLI